MRWLGVLVVVAAGAVGCSPGGPPAPPGRTISEWEKLVVGLPMADVERAAGPPSARLHSGWGRETWWVYRDGLRTPSGVRHARVYFHPDHDVAAAVDPVTDDDLWREHRARWKD
jgi:hypothetical protein